MTQSGQPAMFDHLLHVLKEGDMALAHGRRVSVEGPVGRRKANFAMAQGQYDEGMAADPHWLVDTLREDVGIQARVLFQQTKSHEYGTEHQLVVGSLDEAQGWGLHVCANLDETGDAIDHCKVALLEGTAQVNDTIAGLENAETAKSVASITQIIQAHTSMDPTRLVQLRQALSRHEIGRTVLAVWDAQCLGQELETRTPAATTSGKHKPGRL